MLQAFVDALAENLADVLTIALVAAGLIGAVLFWRARQRHVKSLRAKVLGEVPVPGKIQETLACALNSDAAEVAAIGTVTLVDIAWHYSMADPQIWDHFHGPAADHIADAVQNLDVLKASLGEQALQIAENIAGYLRSLEATQIFHDVLERLSLVDGISDSSALVLDAHSDTLVHTLASSASTLDAAHTAESVITAKAAGLLTHIPLITIGFASYRAWRRAERGAGWGRNVEFAAIEVAARAGGGLLGGQVGGTIGTIIVPGIGTLVGGVIGAVAGAVGGALLGESLKGRHVRGAQHALDESLNRLGETYLADPSNFQRLRQVFIIQEQRYVENLLATRRRLHRYALLPWRVLWPNEKMILLQETVAMAERRLSQIKQGTIEAVERLELMRSTAQHRQMGIILWSDRALCEELGCSDELLNPVEQANTHLRRELTQLGRLPSGAAA
ncbi:MAG: hypothetical protein Kow00124_01530 [Anaerolineae bacterium]